MTTRRWIVLTTTVVAPVTAALTLAGSAFNARAQDHGIEGMWSDPPATPEDFFCSGHCTAAGLEYLGKLLDDPANDERSFRELAAEARGYGIDSYIRPRLSAAALETFPLDPLDDPSYLRCEPYGLAREAFSRHQLEIHRYADHIELHYGEWDLRRTAWFDAGAIPADAPPRPLGYSVASFDGDELVIRSFGISANNTRWASRHSDELTMIERFRRDGDRLLMTATYEDPWGLKEPLEIRKVWGWAPDQQIFPYVDCEPGDRSAGEE